jgi:exosortase D (VPLPA-CTERM-specific)
MTATPVPLELRVERGSNIESIRYWGLVWLFLAALGVVGFYWSGLASLAEIWSRPEYSHGYFIPVVAAFLLLTRLDAPTTNDASNRWLGLVVIGLGIGVGLLGNLSQIPTITLYGLIIVIGGLVAVTAGLRTGHRRWVPVAYLVFMLPLPNTLYWPLSIELQLVSSQIGVAVISAFGIPVYLEGNVIDLGTYQLQVAEACSGLRYLLPLMSFGFLFAALYKGPAWQKLLLFLSTVPITVLMNSVRIGLIGVAIDRYGIEQAEGVLHAFEGWIIFIACLALLYLLATSLRLLHRKTPRPELFDIEPGVLMQRLARVRHLKATPALVTAAGVLLAAGLAWQLAPSPAVTLPQRAPLSLFPTDLADWQGKREVLDAHVEKVLGADDYLVAEYSGGAGIPVSLLIAYYHSQIDGSGIHSPEICLPAGGWEVSRWAKLETGLTTAAGQPLTVSRAVIQKGASRQLVYFWFEQRGRALASDYAAKAYTVLDGITRGRTDGALVRLITPIAPTEDEVAAENRLLDFLSLVAKELPTYFPE